VDYFEMGLENTLFAGCYCQNYRLVIAKIYKMSIFLKKIYNTTPFPIGLVGFDF